MRAPQLLSGLTRRVSIAGLRPHHVGREFVGYGALRGVAFTREGYTLDFSSASGPVFVRGTGDEELHYWVDDAELHRRRLPNDQRGRS